MFQSEMVESWGYPVEEHFVTTQDGYILRLHRIPRGRNERAEDVVPGQKPAVFLTHCLLCSSAVFSFGPPENREGGKEGGGYWQIGPNFTT